MSALTCICCGSDYLLADYPVASSQGIVAEVHGTEVVMDYDGCTDTYDDAEGDNEVYRCGDCHAQARSVEALVGEDPHGACERLALVQMIQGKLTEAAALAEELARTPIGKPPLVPESETTPEQEQAAREAGEHG